jgi:DNA-3-methyladenine glycosylase I
MLLLESFQAGLSWECVLNKRESFKKAYDNFDINKIIKYDDDKIKELLNNDNIENLIKIIKTAYLRNQNRLDSNKKISEKDSYYFKRAEELLYYEIGTVLNMNFDDTKKYIINKVEELVK